MDIKVDIKEVEPQKVITLRAESPYAEIAGAMEKNFGRLMAYLEKQSIMLSDCAGPGYARYFSVDNPEAWVYEIGFPINDDLEGEGDIKMSELPGGRAAITTLVGSYDGLKDTWARLTNWMQASGHTPVGAPWESYRIMPPQETDPSKWETDIIWPIQ